MVETLKNLPTKARENNEKYKLHVLLAEDKEYVLKITKRMLESLGCTVHVVGNGEEMLQALKDAQPDTFGLLITDIEMPKMDGITALAEIRKNGNNIPVIVYSGFSAEEAAAINDLNATFLGKPFSLGELSEAIKKSLDIQALVGKKD